LEGVRLHRAFHITEDCLEEVQIELLFSTGLVVCPQGSPQEIVEPALDNLNLG
jgi:hypothetical protein